MIAKQKLEDVVIDSYYETIGRFLSLECVTKFVKLVYIISTIIVQVNVSIDLSLNHHDDNCPHTFLGLLNGPCWSLLFAGFFIPTLITVFCIIWIVKDNLIVILIEVFFIPFLVLVTFIVYSICNGLRVSINWQGQLFIAHTFWGFLYMFLMCFLYRE